MDNKQELDIFNDIANVDAYLLVADKSNFSKAAKILGCSQPSISGRINRIESALGRRMFIRKRKGVHLTEEGKALYKVMRRHQTSLRTAQAELERIKGKQFSFIIGASDLIYDYVLPKYMYRLQDDVDRPLLFKHDSSENLIDALRDNTIDLAIVELEADEDTLECQAWLKDEIVFFSRHPMGQYITPESLYRASLLFHTKESSIQKKVNTLFRRFNIDPMSLDIIVVNDQLASIKQAVLHCDRPDDRPIVSWMPKLAIEHELALEYLYATRMGKEPIEQHFFIAYRKEFSGDLAIETILKHLKSSQRSAQSAE